MKLLTLLFSVLAVTLSGWAEAAPPKGDPDKGRLIASQVCVVCHGLDGNGTEPVNPEFPKLAAKQPEYLFKQLKDFKAAMRKNDIMAAMVANLSAEDMANLALFYSGQKAKPGAAKNPGLLVQGKKVYLEGNPESGVPACAGCHEPDALGYGNFPHLAGQHAEYTLMQLKRFNTGERDNDKGLAMQSVTSKMTADEMKSVAEYLADTKVK